MHSNHATSSFPGAANCRSCGGPIAERWNTAHTQQVRFCTNPACAMHGIPSLHGGVKAVTLDARGDVVGQGS